MEEEDRNDQVINSVLFGLGLGFVLGPILLVLLVYITEILK